MSALCEELNVTCGIFFTLGFISIFNLVKSQNNNVIKEPELRQQQRIHSGHIGDMFAARDFERSSLSSRNLGAASMKVIKTYPTTVDADLARIELDAVAIPSIVVGVGAGMEGGLAGVQLLVPEDQIEAALAVLGAR